MRAVIYARYSSELQRDASIEDQIRVCLERIEREGWSLVATYSDRAISAATITNRPGLQALLTDAKAGKFDAVVAEALDRLSRDQEDVAGLYKRLRYLEIPIITLAEGEVDELHIGLKGTMNALFLKDLASKIRRGQRGRVAAGFAAGGLSYGYDVVHEFDVDGNLVRGKRRINLGQAEVVGRIFSEYVSGMSPRAIAANLNRDGVPAPRGGQWNASTINGHRSRRNGILQNELYIGFLIYNRVRMVKAPDTGKRLSRVNPKETWVVVEVPELRIVSDEFWDRAQATKTHYGHRPAHKLRRPKRLLSGLLFCRECDGAFTITRPGKYGCAAHRDKGTCTNGRQISVERLERRVLAGIKDRLLRPENVAEFIREFHWELKRLRAAETKERAAAEQRLAETETQIQRVVTAITEGTDTPALRHTLLELEEKKLRLAATLTDIRNPPVIELHPNLAEVYRRKVAALEVALNEDEETRREAVPLLRSVIHRIVLQPGQKRGEMTVKVYGEPGAVLALASGDPTAVDLGMITMVAEEGLEPPTRGL